MTFTCLQNVLMQVVKGMFHLGVKYESDKQAYQVLWSNPVWSSICLRSFPCECDYLSANVIPFLQRAYSFIRLISVQIFIPQVNLKFVLVYCILDSHKSMMVSRTILNFTLHNLYNALGTFCTMKRHEAVIHIISIMPITKYVG